MHAVSAFLGQSPPPAPDLCTLASHKLNPLSMPTHMPSLHNFNGQMVPSTCTRYLPFWVKKPHPHLISAHFHHLKPLSTPPHMFPLHPLPHNFNGQTVLSACAWYLPFWVKTPYPCPISVPWLPAPQPTHLCQPTCSLYTLCLAISMHVLGLPFWVKTPHPHPISVPWPPTASTCISTPTNMLSLCPPSKLCSVLVLGSTLPPARCLPIFGTSICYFVTSICHLAAQSDRFILHCKYIEYSNIPE